MILEEPREGIELICERSADGDFGEHFPELVVLSLDASSLSNEWVRPSFTKRNQHTLFHLEMGLELHSELVTHSIHEGLRIARIGGTQSLRSTTSERLRHHERVVMFAGQGGKARVSLHGSLSVTPADRADGSAAPTEPASR